MEKLVRKIGLVAHDAMKKDLIEWVLWNSELLMGHKFYCTGTTGTLILAALREKHPDVEWDFTILKSGPLGGDQQMGSRIVDGEIDYLFFFTDPMTLQPHDTDVKALTRLAGVENIVFCCNRSTADHIISSPLFVDPTYERTVPDYSNYTKRFANKPVVAEAVSAIGKIVLMLCKLFAGLLVFGLILGACALIIALFAIRRGRPDMPLSPHFLNDMNLGIPILGILIVLIPVILLIYVLMCLIASRKPGSKTLLAIFLTWIAGLAMLIGLAYKEKAVDRVRNYQPLGQILNKEVVIESDTTTLRQILRDFDDEKIVEDDLRSVHISVPSKGIEITYDKQTSQLDIEADGKRIRMQADESNGAYIQVDEEEMQQL